MQEAGSPGGDQRAGGAQGAAAAFDDEDDGKEKPAGKRFADRHGRWLLIEGTGAYTTTYSSVAADIILTLREKRRKQACARLNGGMRHGGADDCCRPAEGRD
jgi:hypothetical protein